MIISVLERTKKPISSSLPDNWHRVNGSVEPKSK